MTTKEKKLYVLIVEDLPSDAELAKREVNKVLANATFKVVDTEENYIQALNTFKPDVIISDYKMPAFDGMTALKIRQKKLPMTPFIIFTGSMNETIAVECMKAGADDYVIKEHVKRLGQAVLSALEKKKIENEHNRAEQTIINQNEYLNNVFESISQPFYIIDAVDHTVKMANSAADSIPK